jgi:hypothetical protein
LDVLGLAVNPWKLPVPLDAPVEMLLQSPVAAQVYVTAGEVIGLLNDTPFTAPPLQTSCDAVAGRSFIFGAGLTLIVNVFLFASGVAQSPILGVTVMVAR